MTRLPTFSAVEKRAFGTYETLARILDGPMIKLIAVEKAAEFTNPMLQQLFELDLGVFRTKRTRHASEDEGAAVVDNGNKKELMISDMTRHVLQRYQEEVMSIKTMKNVTFHNKPR